MGDAIGALMSALLVMSVLGMAGYKIAKDQNRNPLLGLALGAFIPLVGVGILLMLGRKINRRS